MLLDEPLGALDLKLREQMQLELKDIQRNVGITFIFVTHDQEEAFTIADRVLILHDGVIVREGTPSDVWANPGSMYVARFLGLGNIMDGEVVAKNQFQTE